MDTALQQGSATMATKEDEAERLRGLLRHVRCPGFQRDIVALGFVKAIEVEGGRATVRFAPDTRSAEKISRMENDIRETLTAAGRCTAVEILRETPFAEVGVLSPGGIVPKEPAAPAAAEGDSKLTRPDIAREAGYDEDGPEPLGGPRGDTYEGELPVLQWQIDPHDPSAKSGTANLEIGKWEFRVWWQVHPLELVYASIQALRSDWVEHGGAARAHPVGRNEAVNLVYDAQRKAVVAIYGTVRDFRPFVDAFYRGYVLKN